MDLLSKLQKSRVAATLSQSDLCQPVKYDNTQVNDPFEDMVDMEAMVSRYRSPRCSLEQVRSHKSFTESSKPVKATVATVNDIIHGILFALDGTFQLLDKADAQQKVDAFVKNVIDDLATKKSLKAAKVRWLSPRVEKVREELMSKRYEPPSLDLLELLSVYLGAGVTLWDRTHKTCDESGWGRYGMGVVLEWCATSGIKVVDEGSQVASGLRVITSAQKTELLCT